MASHLHPVTHEVSAPSEFTPLAPARGPRAGGAVWSV